MSEFTNPRLNGRNVKEIDVEISLVTNGTCDFSGKEEKYLIGLTAKGGKKITLSQECLEMGMKILRAVQEPMPSPGYNFGQPNENKQAWLENPNPIVAPLPHVTPTPPFTPTSTDPTNNSPLMPMVTSQVAPQPKGPAKFDMKSAKKFIDTLEANQKENLDSDERAKEGIYDEKVIKKTVDDLKGSIDIKVMQKVLRKKIGMTEERFEILLSTPAIA